MANTHHAYILIVEDDDLVAQGLADWLDVAGHTTRIATTGLDALRYAAQRAPDLVILDLLLPDMHGNAVATQLRRVAETSHVPILMASALNKPNEQLDGFGHGADAYLTKPFSATELLQTVDLLLSGTVSI